VDRDSSCNSLSRSQNNSQIRAHYRRRGGVRSEPACECALAAACWLCCGRCTSEVPPSLGLAASVACGLTVVSHSTFPGPESPHRINFKNKRRGIKCQSDWQMRVSIGPGTCRPASGGSPSLAPLLIGLSACRLRKEPLPGFAAHRAECVQLYMASSDVRLQLSRSPVFLGANGRSRPASPPFLAIGLSRFRDFLCGRRARSAACPSGRRSEYAYNGTPVVFS
jgi:hypothetical protein